MKVLIVGLKNNYHVDRIREEGQKRQIAVDACLSSALSIRCSNDSFEVLIDGKEPDHDLVYLWAFSKRRWEWITAVDFLARERGTVVVNRKVIDPTHQYYLTPAIDYWKQKEAGILFPRSVVLFSTKDLSTNLAGFSFPVVVKPAEGRKGQNVFKADSIEEVQNILDNLPFEGAAVVREFIPNDGDVRVFTVGYKAIGAMKRTPKAGDFRSNISQGGSGETYDLGARPDIAALAEKVSTVMKTEIAGVDIIFHQETGEPYILETNPGPQFEGLEKFTNVNAAGEIVDYFISLLSKK